MRRQIKMDELSDFYRRIGAALWHVQHLENALVQFLTMKEIHERRRAGKKVVEDAAWKLLAEHRKKLTIGPLIETCKRRRIIKKEDTARYAAFKNERHWLVHRSLIENGDEAPGNDGFHFYDHDPLIRVRLKDKDSPFSYSVWSSRGEVGPNGCGA
jgi:hypothetical protein